MFDKVLDITQRYVYGMSFIKMHYMEYSKSG